MKGGDEMINQYVIEGKCRFQPFTDVDDRGKLFVQINLECSRGLVCLRSYNVKLITDIINEVHVNDVLMITGFINSVTEAGKLVVVLNILEYSLI